MMLRDCEIEADWDVSPVCCLIRDALNLDTEVNLRLAGLRLRQHCQHIPMAVHQLQPLMLRLLSLLHHADQEVRSLVTLAFDSLQQEGETDFKIAALSQLAGLLKQDLEIACWVLSCISGT